MTKRILEFDASSADKGERIDSFVARRSEKLSRSQIKKAADERRLLIDRNPVRAGYKLKAGDRITLELPESIPLAAAPQEIPLDILYEDEDVLVVDKPAGMTVHPAAGNYTNTLVNAVLFHCRDLSGIGGVLRPGIVHRLDKGTSGVMVVAKSDAAHQDLALQFKQHAVKKTYKALVYGSPKEDEGVIDMPIGRHETDRKKMSVKTRSGRTAVTRWRVEERYLGASLLTVNTETGRTHQIRVHLTAAGHPLLGDSIYGNPKRVLALENKLIRARIKSMGRHALHAGSLVFRHPTKETEMSFSTPLPDDIAGLIELLRRNN